MQRLTVEEQGQYGLTPAVSERKKLEGLLLAAEGMATSHCPSAQNNDRVYTERMRFAIYTLARAINSSLAADPANNVVSESIEGYSYSKEPADYKGDAMIAGALKLIDYACHKANALNIGASVRGRRPTRCREEYCG